MFPPLIVNRLPTDPRASMDRWEIVCPLGSMNPLRFWFNAMHTDDRILQAARHWLSMAKHEDNPLHSRAFIMGNRNA